MKLKLLLFTALLTTLTNIAQTKPTETQTPSKIKVYTPTGISSTSSTNDNSYKWAVKTDLLGIISGELPIILEYRFATKFSVEGSAGITYAYLPNDFLSTEDISSNSDNTKAAMGSAFRAAVKYYPSSDYDAIEGWSFGIQLFTKTTNREYESDYSDTPSFNGKKDTKIKTGASIIIGKQVFADSNIAIESFIGLGIANTTRKYYNIDYSTSNPSLQSYETKKTAPSIQLGCRIGFGN